MVDEIGQASDNIGTMVITVRKAWSEKDLDSYFDELG